MGPVQGYAILANWRIKATVKIGRFTPLTAFRKPPEASGVISGVFPGAGPFFMARAKPPELSPLLSPLFSGVFCGVFSAGLTMFSTMFSRQGFSGFHSGFPWAGPFCQKSRKTPGVICGLFCELCGRACNAWPRSRAATLAFPSIPPRIAGPLQP